MLNSDPEKERRIRQLQTKVNRGTATPAEQSEVKALRREQQLGVAAANAARIKNQRARHASQSAHSVVATAAVAVAEAGV